jgi:Holliday junction resolvase RusA-like endonuclease
MTDSLVFTVHAQPIPAPRARITRRGNFYSKQYDTWRALVQVAAIAEAGRPLWDGPVSLEVHAYGAHGLSDWDNIGKGVSDALQGIIYANDRQVRAGFVRLYDCSRKQRRAEITVSRLMD